MFCGGEGPEGRGTVSGWKKDLRVKMRDADDKEVDIGAVSTKSDQHPPGKSYLYQFLFTTTPRNFELKKAL